MAPSSDKPKVQKQMQNILDSNKLHYQPFKDTGNSRQNTLQDLVCITIGSLHLKFMVYNCALLNGPLLHFFIITAFI